MTYDNLHFMTDSNYIMFPVTPIESLISLLHRAGDVVVVIVRQLDLLLPMQSVSITTNVGVLDTTLCDKVCQ